ncbi:F-actin-capping protein subunit alpha [Coemansia sp. RSA 2711]|nr:F-actin-capping protein subunit alpha [Coemansia sp. RSA 2711]KAJ1849115.1 F-actin-capping protein subunit alpha [Coemansia sp. RSA 2708]KAJ2358533.1 F-actin-capping protein subunit alpha [Coemansia sp. RSA 2610]KAJ2374785.1 F-actin-capping protein subunit alpha [Coemansia sp. RSA 2611]
MSSDSKIAKAASLLLHSPPGEVDDVFNDIRGIVNDDDALHEHIEPVLAESNMQQFLVTTVPDSESKVLITPYNRVGDTHAFVDPNTRTQFTFDHLHRTATEAVEWTASDEALEHEPLRSSLQQELATYVEAHFTSGSSSVFYHEGALVCCIVSNRFSPTNFWNGSWRAVWSFDPQTGQLNGSAKVKVHYFEDGNVQLDTQTDFTADVSLGDQVAARVVKLIGEFETEFQQSIGDGYRQLAEKTFKGLRRTLPVTRNKIDWDKIALHKIGGELANTDA